MDLLPFRCREGAERGEVEGVVADRPGGGGAAVGQEDAVARHRDAEVGVVDDAAAALVAKDRVIEGREEERRSSFLLHHRMGTMTQAMEFTARIKN